MTLKEVSVCHKLKFSNPYIFETWFNDDNGVKIKGLENQSLWQKLNSFFYFTYLWKRLKIKNNFEIPILFFFFSYFNLNFILNFLWSFSLFSESSVKKETYSFVKIWFKYFKLQPPWNDPIFQQFILYRGTGSTTKYVKTT